jgi:hypothetical protein
MHAPITYFLRLTVLVTCHALQADPEAAEQMQDLLAVLRAVQQRVGATPALRLLDDVLEVRRRVWVPGCS